MHVEYLPLLKLSLRHDYFSDGNCPVVNVVPTEATAAVMQQQNIRLVPKDYGVDLFHDVARPVTPGTELSFLLQVTDHRFFLYTDVPSSQSSLQLNPAGTPGAQFLNQVVYTVAEDNLPDNHRITFTARATIWRYWIIDPQNTFDRLELRDIATKTTVGASAAPPEMRELPNGVQAQVLTSTTAISLREYPEIGFELLMTKSEGGAQQTMPLPAASPNTVSRETSVAGFPYSDIYVYL